MESDSKVSLPIWQLISLVASITISAGGVGFWQSSQMWELDRAWQERIGKITDDFGDKIETVQQSIPPDWFRTMVERNQAEIKRIETEITRDFVRKTELDQILKNGDK